MTAFSDEGLVGVELTYGTVNAEKFTDFLRGTLVPEMQPFSSVKYLMYYQKNLLSSWIIVQFSMLYRHNSY